jgi:hypothetical protein
MSSKYLYQKIKNKNKIKECNLFFLKIYLMIFVLDIFKKTNQNQLSIHSSRFSLKASCRRKIFKNLIAS